MSDNISAIDNPLENIKLYPSKRPVAPFRVYSPRLSPPSSSGALSSQALMFSRALPPLRNYNTFRRCGTVRVCKVSQGSAPLRACGIPEGFIVSSGPVPPITSGLGPLNWGGGGPPECCRGRGGGGCYRLEGGGYKPRAYGALSTYVLPPRPPPLLGLGAAPP